MCEGVARHNTLALSMDGALGKLTATFMIASMSLLAVSSNLHFVGRGARDGDDLRVMPPIFFMNEIWEAAMHVGI